MEMISAFILQTGAALLFFFGLAGLGLLILKIFNISKKNFFFKMGMAFFLSLCLYVLLGAFLLFLFPDKLLFLKYYSIIYFLVSYFFLFFNFKNRFKFFFRFLANNWLLFLALVFVLLVFFLQIYQTALFDEWLHRPVVNFFVNNGQFPFVNPYNSDESFINKYHYGLYLPAASFCLLTKFSVSEVLDILKLSFAIGGFSFIYGIILGFSKKRGYATLATILILFCGGSFFFWDGFTLNHLSIWGKPKIAFNTPILYLMAGITWVNVIMALSFVWLTEKVFYKKAEFDLIEIFIFLIILAGFFIISELFAALVLFLFLLSAFICFLKKRINVTKVLIVLSVFIAIIIFAFLTGGVLGGLLEGPGGVSGLSKILWPRSFSEWGYPSSKDILNPFGWWLVYLRNYFLEIILAGVVLWGIIKKKIAIKEFPLIHLALLICLIVPFISSTSFGDINLAKLTVLWPVLLYIIFFHLLFKINYNKKIFIPILILFIVGSAPLLIVNAAIQWRGGGISGELRCRENNLCYNQKIIEQLRTFEKEHPGIKRFLVANRGEAQQVIDETNSVIFIAEKKISKAKLVNKDVDFVFYTSGMSRRLTDEAKINISECSKGSFKNDYFKIIEIDKEKCKFLVSGKLEIAE